MTENEPVLSAEPETRAKSTMPDHGHSHCPHCYSLMRYPYGTYEVTRADLIRAADVIITGFPWAKSPEGDAFWRRVWNALCAAAEERE